MPSPGRTRGEIDAETDWEEREGRLAQARTARTGMDQARRELNPDYRRAQAAYTQGNVDADLFSGRTARRATVPREIDRLDKEMAGGVALKQQRDQARQELTDPYVSKTVDRTQRYTQDTAVRSALARALGQIGATRDGTTGDLEGAVNLLAPLILGGKMAQKRSEAGDIALPAEQAEGGGADDEVEQIVSESPASMFSADEALDQYELDEGQRTRLRTALRARGYR
jgi:hypothetical protein